MARQTAKTLAFPPPMLEALERIADAWTERGTAAGAPERAHIWGYRWQWSDVVREACRRLIEADAGRVKKLKGKVRS